MYLEGDAECLNVQAFNTIKEYFCAREVIRAKMMAADYLGIGDKQLITKFIIKLLSNHEHFNMR